MSTRATARAATSNPRRRKVLASDVFTACYTAIMATAAVADAGRKDRRRRELDTRIAEAKSSLAVMLGESAARDLAKVVDSPYPNFPYFGPVRLDVLDDICKLPPDYLRDLPQKRKDRLDAVQKLRTIFALDWDAGVPERRKSTLARCEEVIDAEQEALDRLGREPKTETHMDKVTDMINDVVDRLMGEAWRASEVEAPGSHPAPNSPDSASTMIRMLRSDGYPSYSHPDLDPPETLRQRARLNEVNMKILENWAPPLRERLVAKMCYNLLVCKVSPGIQNYNLLMLGFSFLGEHKLSQAVVDSFLFLSHMKPTEATYLCLLQHYRLKGDTLGFQGVIRRLFGYDPRGIGLMRRTADHVARYPDLKAWAATEDVGVVNGHYVQRAPLTQDVAEAMMEGLIDFGMLREGAKLFAVCLREQWTVNKDLLWRLFHSCLDALDTAAAKMVIRGLIDNIEQASLMLIGPESICISSRLVRQLHHLLNIWQTATLPGKDRLDDEGFQPRDFTMENEKANLNHLATAIAIRETLNYSSIMSRGLKKARQALSKKNMPLSDRLDEALSALNFAIELPAQKAENAGRLQRLAKIDWLTRQTAVHAYRIRNAENALTRILAKQTPRELRTKSQFNASIPIAERIKLALPYGTPGTREYETATCFQLSREIDLQLKRVLMRALPTTHARGLMKTQNDSGDVSLGEILAYFEEYLANVKSRAAKEEEAARPDPFARLLEKIARPKTSFWKRGSAAVEPAAAASSGHVGW